MKKIALLGLVGVTLVSLVGGAYLYYSTEVFANNTYKAGSYKDENVISIDNWTPGTEVEKVVNVTNEENIAINARIKYSESWVAIDGTVLSGYSNSEAVAQFTIGENWEKAEDGYYYYKYVIEPKETTTNFISSVTFNKNFELVEGRDIICTQTTNGSTITATCNSTESGYAGATYKLDITVETIQSDINW